MKYQILVTLLIAVGVSMLMSCSATDQKNDRLIPKKQILAINNKVYVQLKEIEQHIANDQHQKALEQIKSLEKNGVNGRQLNSYELANVYNLASQSYIKQGRTVEAINSAIKILPLSPPSPLGTRLYTLKSLVSLYMEVDRKNDALIALEYWKNLSQTQRKGVSQLDLAILYETVGDRKSAKSALNASINHISLPPFRQHLPIEVYELLASIYSDAENQSELDAVLATLKKLAPETNHKLLIEHYSGNVTAESKRVLENMENDYYPIIKVAPIYPWKASQEKIEGYCIVEYMVKRSGSVYKPKVVECIPKGYFEKASLLAVKKFKYKPRVVDGKSVDVPNVQNRFTFEIGY